MQWELSHRADPQAAQLADRHYSRKKVGSKQFVQAAKCLVLLKPTPAISKIPDGIDLLDRAAWVSVWPFAEYVRHDWGGEFPNEHTRNVERLLKVDPSTGEPTEAKGHRSLLPLNFVQWVDDSVLVRRRQGQLVTVRKALVHETPGSWGCSFFRNETRVLSSHLIRQAVAATCAVWGEPPAMGMITMIEPSKVRSKGAGRAYLEAGFRNVGETRTKPYKNVFQLLPEDMPPARPPRQTG